MVAVNGYFPTLDMDTSSGESELRWVNVAPAQGAKVRYQRRLQPPSETEGAGVDAATLSLDTWLNGQSQYTDPVPVSIIIQGKKPSKDSSLQLLVAALCWAARSPGTPRYVLVATGALSKPEDIASSGRLSVLPVGGVAAKAATVARDMGLDSPLKKLVTSAGKSGQAAQTVLFAYPFATPPAEADAAIAALKGLNVETIAVEDFNDLLRKWHPDGFAMARAAPPDRRKTPPTEGDPKPPEPPRQWRKVLVAGGVLTVLAVATAAIVGPSGLEDVVAMARVPQDVRRLAVDAARTPDDGIRGCAAMISAASQVPSDGGFGWGAARRQVSACQALTVCDQKAGAVFDHVTGQTLKQIGERPDEIEAVRQQCLLAMEGFPTLARVPYQLYRVAKVAVDHRQSTDALARAVDLGHPPAIVENAERSLANDPVRLKARLQELTIASDAHPEALVTYAEHVVCGVVAQRAAGQTSANTEADLRDAASLLRRANAHDVAKTGNARARIKNVADVITDLKNGTSTDRPARFCAFVTQRGRA